MFIYFSLTILQTKDWFLHQRECKVLTKVKAIHEPSWWTCPHDYTAHVRLLIRMHKRTVEVCGSLMQVKKKDYSIMYLNHMKLL